MTKSIVQDTDIKVCYLCGRNGNGDPLERHHVFGAANRKLSEEDGLWVWLCGDRCHRNGPDSVHQNATVAAHLKHDAEVAWIYHNKSNREEFRKRYGKDYMEDF